MKTLAKSLGSVALVLAVAFAYLVFGARLQVSLLSENVVPAAAYPEVFEKTMEDIRTGVLTDRVYGDAGAGSIEDYCFVEMRLTARSFGLLPCQWVVVRVTPMPGDIALATEEMPDVAPLSRSEATVLVLAKADSVQTGHAAWIEYYAFGARSYADAVRR